MGRYIVGLRTPFGGHTRIVFYIEAENKTNALKKAMEIDPPWDGMDYWVIKLKESGQRITSYAIPNSYVG